MVEQAAFPLLQDVGWGRGSGRGGAGRQEPPRVVRSLLCSSAVLVRVGQRFPDANPQGIVQQRPLLSSLPDVAAKNIKFGSA